MLAKEVLLKVAAMMAEIADRPVEIENVVPLAGGDINEVYLLHTAGGKVVVKANSATRFPGMFEAEKAGLELLGSANELRIPAVHGVGEAAGTSFLLLEYLPPAPQQPDFWQRMGRGLARIHRVTQENFGLDHDNYIGSLHQSNRAHSIWAEFLVQERLEVQCRMARDTGKMDRHTAATMERLYYRLEALFPIEPPALIHGDLWSGNYHVGSVGEPCLIDPAVHFGHREMDIAMTRLFGGFSPAFYEAYQSEWPLADDWESRLSVANLYPLLVHVNLFGGGYLAQVQSILRNFS